MINRYFILQNHSKKSNMKKAILISALILGVFLTFSAVSTNLNAKDISLSDLINKSYAITEGGKDHYTPLYLQEWCANGNICTCNEYCYIGGIENCCICITCPCTCWT
jgi:hypothetical protein